MANFVIAGRVDDGATARAELLADTMALSLPTFKVRKILLPAAEWDAFLKETNAKWGWKHSSSPLIWRQLGEASTAATYVGGEKPFASLVQEWYGVSLDPTPSDIAERVADNIRASRQPRVLSAAAPSTVTLAITNAATSTAYALCASLLSGDVFFGSRVDVRLLDTEANAAAVQGLVMEVEDCAVAHVRARAQIAASDKQAVAGCDVLVLLDPPAGGDKAEALSGLVTSLAAVSAESLPKLVVIATENGDRDAQALIVGVPSLSPARVTVPMLLCEQRARHLLAVKLNTKLDASIQIPAASIKNVVVWGTPRAPLVDIHHAHLVGGGGIVGPGQQTEVIASLRDEAYANTELPKLLLERTEKSGHGGSRAKSIAGHLALLTQGTPEGQCVSMCVMLPAGGAYGLPGGVVASVPVTAAAGQWTIVQGLPIKPEVREEILKRYHDNQYAVVPGVDAEIPRPSTLGISEDEGGSVRGSVESEVGGMDGVKSDVRPVSA